MKNKEFFRQYLDMSIMDNTKQFNTIDELFQKDFPLIVEVGIGNGEFMENHCRQFRHRNYIGIEVSDKFAIKSLKKFQRLGYHNISVWSAEAVSAIQENIPDSSVERIYVNFSDPWPKKRHHKRRLIQKEFLDEAWRILKDPGYLFIATDHDDYGRDIVGKLSEYTGFRSIYDTLYVGRLENYYQTKYERIMRGELHDVYYFALLKTPR